MSSLGELFTEKDEPELPDLYLVAAREIGFLNSQFIHIGAVQAAHIDDPEGIVLPDLRVPPRHGDVVQKDIALRVPSSSRDILSEDKPRSRVGPPLHNQHGRSGSELVLGHGDLRLLLNVGLHGRQRYGRLALGGGGQVRAAFAAVHAVFRIALSASGAKHVSLPFLPAAFFGQSVPGDHHNQLADLGRGETHVLDQPQDRSPLFRRELSDIHIDFNPGRALYPLLAHRLPPRAARALSSPAPAAGTCRATSPWSSWT